MISRKLIETVKLFDIPAYKIAHQARLHPSTLSKILCGIDEVKPGDPRVVRVAKVLGLSPSECFEGTNEIPEAKTNQEGAVGLYR